MSRRFTAVLWACAAGWLAGCGGGDESPGQAIAFTVVETSQNSAIRSFRAVVVNDASAWATPWGEHTANQVPPPALPPVDFSRRTVVGVFLGERPSGCHAVSIESIENVSDRKLVVSYRERVPGPLEACATVMTYPATLVALPASVLPVDFVAAQ